MVLYRLTKKNLLGKHAKAAHVLANHNRIGIDGVLVGILSTGKDTDELSGIVFAFKKAVEKLCKHHFGI
jgi:hypothetical protein